MKLLRLIVGYIAAIATLGWAITAWETGHWVPGALAAVTAFLGWGAIRALGGS